MIDIGCLLNHLHAGESKSRIDEIQDKGRILATRITASFNLAGRRAVQFVSEDGEKYQSLIHNEADDPTDYLVVHPIGIQEHSFEALNIDGKWITNYIEMEVYDQMMKGIGDVLLEFANDVYRKFMLRNGNSEPEPLSERDVDLDSFAEELSKRKLSLSHHGNMRLAFR